MTAVVGQPIEIDLTTGLNPMRFPALSNETCLNLFEFEGAMIPTAGFENILAVLGSSTIEARGIFYSDILERCVVVLGTTLFSVTTTHFTKLGELNTSVGKVFFAENGLSTVPNASTGDPGAQVAVSDNLNIYVFTLDNVLRKATDENGDPLGFSPGTLAFQNGFFFVNAIDSNRIYASSINNGGLFPLLNFDLAGSKTRSCLGFKNLLYVFAKDVTNIFYSNPSEPTFPYSPDVSRAWDYGCLAAGSVASSLGIMAWLGNTRYGNPTILMSTGGHPQSFSTPGIDSLINTFQTPQDAEGFIYEEEGHTFYQLNFDADNFTLLYDFTSKKWSGLTDASGLNKSPIRQTAYYEESNTLLGIRNDDGVVVSFGVRFFNYNGEIVPRTIITQNYTQNERPMILQELDLQIEQGENQNTSRVCLSISKDRGRTYPINRVNTLGPIGDRRNLLRWRKLGYARWWTFKFNFFSLDRFVILKSVGWFQE